MQDQIITRIQQARTHLRAGSMNRAVALLEQARAMTRGDEKMLVLILRELIDAYRVMGRKEQAALLAEELGTLAPGASTGEVELSPLERTERPRRLIMVTGILAGSLLIAIGAIIWMLSGRHYDAISVPVPDPNAQATSAGPTGNSGTTVTPPTAVTPVSPGVVPPAVPPTATTGPAASTPDRAIPGNVGLLLHVARYQGSINGRMCRLEIPVGSGTCFAIGSNGIMLTNKHVTSLDDTIVPPDCSAFNLPTLTRRSLKTMVCLGPEPADHFDAEILHESPRYDFAVIRVKKTFDRPMTLGGVRPRLGQQVYAVGFPGVVVNVLQEMNADQIQDQLTKAAMSGSVTFTQWFSADVYEPTLTRGIVSAASRQLQNGSYIQVDATITEGASGGPLLTDNAEVVGICSARVAGMESYNFALSIPQVRAEIEQFLRKP